MNTRRAAEQVKRILDCAGAALLLGALAPLLAVVAGAVWLVMGRPVIFRQTRVGQGEKPFVLLKFRTMIDRPDLPDAQRLTPLGSRLRRTSLDELPQLVNILRGEMSFVGPRPLFERYLRCFTWLERRRHLVKPGLTGWAQIHGRNHMPWDERLALDVWYVDNGSLWLDAAILLHTAWQVVRGAGVAEAPDTLMDDLDVERAATAEEIP